MYAYLSRIGCVVIDSRTRGRNRQRIESARNEVLDGVLATQAGVSCIATSRQVEKGSTAFDRF